MKHLLGNEPHKIYLERALKAGSLHHALLLSGPEGIGKSLFAKAIAASLLQSTKGNHPDLMELRPEGKSGTHSIEQLREMIDEVHKPPFEATRRVFIIYEAERMQLPAANALLKTLEEPTLYSTLILLSSAPYEMLPTILSRCQRLTFQPIAMPEIARFLEEKHQIEPERAIAVARLSEGSLGRALSILHDKRREQGEELLFSFLEGKMPSWQAIESIDALFHELEGLEYHKYVEELLNSYLMRIRDREVILAQQVTALPEALAKVAKIKTALERNIKLSACLDLLFSK
jgi:DNA polymerase-3 subunit delta'